MKTLPDGRIQVEKGDTLWNIYGSNWKQLSGYTGDPTKLPIGTILPAKPAASLGGDLTDTLEEGGGVEPTGQERTLPTEAPGNLSVFKDLMKQITDKYSRASTMTGFGAATGILGVKPEAISGRSLAGIVDFVKGQAVPGIADIYTSTVNLLEETRTRAERQLNTLISTGGLMELSDKDLSKLSNMADWDYEYLMGVKSAQEAEAKAPKSWSIQTIGGRKVRIGFDAVGNIVSRVDLGVEEEPVPDWFRMEIMREYAAKGLSPTEKVFEDRWQKESMEREKFKWEKGGEPTEPTKIEDLPDDQIILVRKIQEAIDYGDITYSEAVEEFSAIAKWLKPSR